ncbi:hypothetical protein LXL04_025384 [Taraxacum kok-saghyz]
MRAVGDEFDDLAEMSTRWRRLRRRRGALVQLGGAVRSPPRQTLENALAKLAELHHLAFAITLRCRLRREFNEFAEPCATTFGPPLLLQSFADVVRRLQTAGTTTSSSRIEHRGAGFEKRGAEAKRITIPLQFYFLASDFYCHDYDLPSANPTCAPFAGGNTAPLSGFRPLAGALVGEFFPAGNLSSRPRQCFPISKAPLVG